MILSLLCIGMWASSDVLIKAFSIEETHTQYKIVVWNAIAYCSTAAFLAIFFNDQIDFANFGHTMLIALPESLSYCISIFLLCLSMKYLECAISSTVVQISGALTVIGVVISYLVTGKAASIFDVIGPLEIAGTVIITFGMVFLSHHLSREDHQEKARLSFLALFIPLFGGLFDALSGTFETLLLTGDFEESFTAAEDFLIDGIIFTIAGIFAELYILRKEKKLYNPFAKGQLAVIGCAYGESIGSVLSIYAIEQAPFIAIPVTSAYCAITVLFSRLFLKEKLTRRKYLYVFTVIAGILLLAIADTL